MFGKPKLVDLAEVRQRCWAAPDAESGSTRQPRTRRYGCAWPTTPHPAVPPPPAGGTAGERQTLTACSWNWASNRPPAATATG